MQSSLFSHEMKDETRTTGFSLSLSLSITVAFCIESYDDLLMSIAAFGKCGCGSVNANADDAAACRAILMLLLNEFCEWSELFVLYLYVVYYTCIAYTIYVLSMSVYVYTTSRIFYVFATTYSRTHSPCGVRTYCTFKRAIF